MTRSGVSPDNSPNSLSDLGDFSGGVSGLSQICVYFLVNSRLFTAKIGVNMSKSGDSPDNFPKSDRLLTRTSHGISPTGC